MSLFGKKKMIKNRLTHTPLTCNCSFIGLIWELSELMFREVLWQQWTVKGCKLNNDHEYIYVEQNNFTSIPTIKFINIFLLRFLSEHPGKQQQTRGALYSPVEFLPVISSFCLGAHHPYTCMYYTFHCHLSC